MRTQLARIGVVVTLVVLAATSAVLAVDVQESDPALIRVSTELAEDPRFADVAATTGGDGTITLTGTVPTWEAWGAAEMVASEAGAPSVLNLLVVESDEPPLPSGRPAPLRNCPRQWRTSECPPP